MAAVTVEFMLSDMQAKMNMLARASGTERDTHGTKFQVTDTQVLMQMALQLQCNQILFDINDSLQQLEETIEVK